MIDHHSNERVTEAAKALAYYIKCNPDMVIIVSHRGEVMLKPIGILNNSYIPGYSGYPHMGEVYTGLKTLEQCVTTPESKAKEEKPKTNNQKLLLL